MFQSWSRHTHNHHRDFITLYSKFIIYYFHDWSLTAILVPLHYRRSPFKSQTCSLLSAIIMSLSSLLASSHMYFTHIFSSVPLSPIASCKNAIARWLSEITSIPYSFANHLGLYVQSPSRSICIFPHLQHVICWLKLKKTHNRNSLRLITRSDITNLPDSYPGIYQEPRNWYIKWQF